MGQRIRVILKQVKFLFKVKIMPNYGLNSKILYLWLWKPIDVVSSVHSALGKNHSASTCR